MSESGPVETNDIIAFAKSAGGTVYDSLQVVWRGKLGLRVRKRKN